MAVALPSYNCKDKNISRLSLNDFHITVCFTIYLYELLSELSPYFELVD